MATCGRCGKAEVESGEQYCSPCSAELKKDPPVPAPAGDDPLPVSSPVTIWTGPESAMHDPLSTIHKEPERPETTKVQLDFSGDDPTPDRQATPTEPAERLELESPIAKVEASSRSIGPHPQDELAAQLVENLDQKKTGSQSSRKKKSPVTNRESDIYHISNYSVGTNALEVQRGRKENAEPPLPLSVIRSDEATPRSGSDLVIQTEPPRRPRRAPEDPTSGEAGDRHERYPGLKDIAYFSGSTVRFTGGVRLHSGDEIAIGDRSFILRAKGTSKLPIVLAGAVAGVLALAALIYSLVGKPTPPSVLSGVVYDRASKQLVGGVGIKIAELGKTVGTDELGYFRFDDLAPGTYTLEALTPDGSAIRKKVEIQSEKSGFVTLAVPARKSPLPLLGSPDQPPPNLARTVPEAGRTPRASQKGNLKIAVSVPNATVRLDGKLLGVGNTTYVNVKSGSHRVAISKMGYKPWQGIVDIPQGGTTTISAALESDQEGPAKSLSFDDYLKSAQKKSAAGDHSGAVADYEKALNLSPNNPLALAGRGVELAETGDRAKALNDFRQAGSLFFSDRKYGLAAENFSRALDIAPSDGDLLLRRAQSYFRAGQLRESREDYKALAKQAPNSAQAYAGWGLCEFQFGNMKEAIKVFEKATQLAPTTAEYYGYLTMAHFESGNRDKARKYYTKFSDFANLLDKQAFEKYPTWQMVTRAFGS